MIHFATRRTLNPQTGKFTNNFSPTTTRYVRVSEDDNGAMVGHSLNKDGWMSEVWKRSTSGDVVIYVHGFNTPMHFGLATVRRIDNGLRAQGFGGVTVGYAWPSQGRLFNPGWPFDGELTTYTTDRNMAKKSAPMLVEEVIWPLQAANPLGRVHLIAHSMGSFLTLRAFAKFEDAAGPKPGKWGIDQALFVASDADRDSLKEGVGESMAMDRRVTRLTNYHSMEDKVLDISWKEFNGKRKRAGQHGIGSRKPKRFTDVSATKRYLTQYEPRDRTTRWSHRWYFYEPGFFRDAALTLTGKDAASMPTREAGGEEGARLIPT